MINGIFPSHATNAKKLVKMQVHPKMKHRIPGVPSENAGSASAMAQKQTAQIPKTSFIVRRVDASGSFCGSGGG